jgi:hypothetical protein
MARVREAVAKALALGWTPIFAPWLWDAKGPDGNWMLDDAKPEQRAVALECCANVIDACDAFLVIEGERTEGMLADLDRWDDVHGLGDEESGVTGYYTVATLTAPECACGAVLTREQLEAFVQFCDECGEAVDASDC